MCDRTPPAKPPLSPRRPKFSSSLRWTREAVLFCVGLHVSLDGAQIACAQDVQGAPAPAAVYAHRADVRRGKLSPQSQARTEALLAFYKGARLEARGNLSGAQAAFEAALELDPASAGLASKLARIAAALGEPQYGLRVLRESLENNPTDPQAYLNLAKFCEAAAERLEQSAAEDETGTSEGEAAMLRVQGQDAAQMAVSKFPDRPEVYWQLLRAYLAQNRKEAARKMVQTAITRGVPSPGYWLQMGELAQQAWPLADSESYDAHLTAINAIYEKALVRANDNPAAIVSVADYYSQTRQYDRAVELYRQVINLDPTLLLAREKLARVLGVLQLGDEKLRALTELVTINPHNSRIQKFIGDEYKRRDDPQRAIEHYLAAVKAGEDDPVFLGQLIEQMLDEGMAETALPVIKRAHFLYPDAFSITLSLARAYTNLEHWSDALRSFRSAERQVQQESAEFLDSAFYFEYGTVAQRAQQQPRAALLFRKSIAAAPREEPRRAAEAYAALGRMWLDQGERIAEAAELIRRAIKLEPERPEYLASLGRYHILKSDYPRAIEILRQAEKAANRPIADILDNLAQALYHSGEVEDAVRILERAASLPDATAEMADRLANYRGGTKRENSN